MKAALAETQKLEMLDLSGCALRADEFANESGRAEFWLQRGARGKMPWDLGWRGCFFQTRGAVGREQIL